MIFEIVKLHNKPFEDMTLEELYAEKMARGWHRHKMKDARNKISMKKYWLNENKPILSKEEITAKYERGEMTQKQYKTAFANRSTAIAYRMRIDDYMDYADRIVFDEESIIAYLDELIAKRKAEKDKPNRRKGRKGYDPRKRASKYNPDPRRKWATREEQKPMPKLHKARARWKKAQSQDKPTMTAMRRMQPIITWDVEKLMQVAKDRGFFTELSITAQIAETLNITIGGASKLLETGKLSWGQCIVIGSLLEMTPKEFCDVFLSGYFREVTDGVFRAHVDDPSTLLDVPFRMVQVEGVTESEEV